MGRPITDRRTGSVGGLCDSLDEQRALARRRRLAPASVAKRQRREADHARLLPRGAALRAARPSHPRSPVGGGACSASRCWWPFWSRGAFRGSGQRSDSTRGARRRYMRLRIAPYRTDRATAEAVVGLFEGLHKRLLQRWWRRLLAGQPSVALEAHLRSGPDGESPRRARRQLPRAQGACRRGGIAERLPQHAARAISRRLARPPYVLRLKKRSEFITRVRVPDPENPSRL